MFHVNLVTGTGSGVGGVDPRIRSQDYYINKGISQAYSGDSWMYPGPNVPRHGKSRTISPIYPYSSWVFMGYYPLNYYINSCFFLFCLFKEF